MNPEQFLRQTRSIERTMRNLATTHVDLGLLKEKAAVKYPDGTSLMQVGAAHEFGYGSFPLRSWLKVPLQLRLTEINQAIKTQLEQVLLGRQSVSNGLGIVGIVGENIVKGAFTTKGYGTWPDISETTKRIKGSSQVLIDSSILRNSIESKVR